MRIQTIFVVTMGCQAAISLEPTALHIPPSSGRNFLHSITCMVNRLVRGGDAISVTQVSVPLSKIVSKSPRGRPALQRSLGLRRFPSGTSRSTSLRRFSSSISIGEQPEPSIPHFSTQGELIEYLKNLSENESGYFGTDHVHRPSYALWTSWTEIVPGWLIGSQERDSTITLYKRLYWLNKTGVYLIQQMPDQVIKYYGSEIGSESDPLDQVVIESYFLKLLEDEEIAPKLLFYSGYMVPPQLTTYEPDRKVPDISTAGNFHFRYLIMDKMGPSVQQIALRGLSFSDAIYLGREMVLILKKLHDKDIMHGDTHWGNFVLSSDDSDALMLIDFGRARIVTSDDVAQIVCEPTITDSRNPYRTKWGMRNCTPSFRDDIYRAIQMIPMIMYGTEHYEFLKDMEAVCRSNYIEIKNGANFWEFPHQRVAVESGLVLEAKLGNDPNRLLLVREQLSALSRLISDDSDPVSKPPYDEIIAILDILSTL